MSFNYWFNWLINPHKESLTRKHDISVRRWSSRDRTSTAVRPRPARLQDMEENSKDTCFYACCFLFNLRDSFSKTKTNLQRVQDRINGLMFPVNLRLESLPDTRPAGDDHDQSDSADSCGSLSASNLLFAVGFTPTVTCSVKSWRQFLFPRTATHPAGVFSQCLVMRPHHTNQVQQVYCVHFIITLTLVAGRTDSGLGQLPRLQGNISIVGFWNIPQHTDACLL